MQGGELLEVLKLCVCLHLTMSKTKKNIKKTALYSIYTFCLIHFNLAIALHILYMYMINTAHIAGMSK